MRRLNRRRHAGTELSSDPYARADTLQHFPIVAVIDLGDRASWPEQFSDTAEAIAEQVRTWKDVGPDCIAQDLPHSDTRFSALAESALREAASAHFIAAYHASRLLDHEVEGVFAKGLRVCSDGLVTEKLLAAAEAYPDLLPPEAVEQVRAAGPLVWQRGGRRRGLFWVVAPRRALWQVGGFARLFGRWGGEAIFWTEDDEASERPVASLIDGLTDVSKPSLITIAVAPGEIPTERDIWPLAVATLLDLDGGCAEWPLATSLGGERILEVAHPSEIPAAWA